RRSSVLRVIVECIPHGFESETQTIGLMTIVNKGNHKNRPAYGNYEVWETNMDTAKRSPKFDILNHNRDHGFWPLVQQAASFFGYNENKTPESDMPTHFWPKLARIHKDDLQAVRKKYLQLA